MELEWTCSWAYGFKAFRQSQQLPLLAGGEEQERESYRGHSFRGSRL